MHNHSAVNLTMLHTSVLRISVLAFLLYVSKQANDNFAMLYQGLGNTTIKLVTMSKW